jgi:hypothetical protein
MAVAFCRRWFEGRGLSTSRVSPPYPHPGFTHLHGQRWHAQHGRGLLQAAHAQRRVHVGARAAAPPAHLEQRGAHHVLALACAPHTTHHAKVANRNCSVWHGATETGPSTMLKRPHVRGVRVHASTGYNRVDGNRRASRNGRVSSSPAQNPSSDCKIN